MATGHRITTPSQNRFCDGIGDEENKMSLTNSGRFKVYPREGDELLIGVECKRCGKDGVLQAVSSGEYQHTYTCPTRQWALGRWKSHDEMLADYNEEGPK